IITTTKISIRVKARRSPRTHARIVTISSREDSRHGGKPSMTVTEGCGAIKRSRGIKRSGQGRRRQGSERLAASAYRIGSAPTLTAGSKTLLRTVGARCAWESRDPLGTAPFPQDGVVVGAWGGAGAGRRRPGRDPALPLIKSCGVR